LISILLFTAVFFGFSTETFSANDKEIETNVAQVNHYFAMDKEYLPNDQVVSLASSVIQNREFYSNETVAKVFYLLAEAATNKGDAVRAMQFALDGKGLIGLDPGLALSFLLKIASGHYIEGKFKRVKIVAEQAVKLASKSNNPQSLLKALSYRAMANALIAEDQLAFADLQQVERLLTQYQKFADHIGLLEVLAIAHYYLHDYSASITLYNKVIKLRIDLNKTINIDHSYYSLARSYLHLDRLDDSYNAFWQAKNYAEKQGLPIKIAFAQMGLGQVLLSQQHAAQALTRLQTAESLFQGQSLTRPYFTTLIYLSKAASILNLKDLAYESLEKAEKLAEQIDFTNEQIEVYQLLSAMYQEKNQLKKALIAQQKYLMLYKQLQKSHVVSHEKKLENNHKNRDISLKLAEHSGLISQFNDKYRQQKELIWWISILLFVFLILVLFLVLKIRAMKLNKAYDEVEKPVDYIANSTQTKKYYQLQFKMSRKYQYPLVVGYLSVDNWKELTFHFNKKIINEVAKTIAVLVNEYSDEFDQVGLIHEGEYLLLCPHQGLDEVKAKFSQMVDALNVRFFANLGEFSVKMSYAYKVPSLQDIDPYIFLARLSESTITKVDK